MLKGRTHYGSYCGLNENGTQRFIYLTVCSLVGGSVLGRFQRCGHVGGGVSLSVGFEVSKASCDCLSAAMLQTLAVHQS